VTGSSQHIADVEGYRQALSERDSIITRLGQANAVLLGEKEALEAALANAMNEIDLLRRRLYGSKSERGGTSELQLLLGPAQVEHDEILRCIDEAAGAAGAPAPVSTGGPAPVSTGVLEEPAAPPPAPAAPEPAHPSRDGGESVDSGEGKADESGAAAAPDTTAPPQRPRPSPKGRRDLSASKLARVVVELRDARMERVGKFIRWEDSFRLLRQRAELKVLMRRRAVYEVDAQDGVMEEVGEVADPGATSATSAASANDKVLRITCAPPTLFPRGMLHESVVSWLLVQKFALGVPHHRLEQHLAAQGESLDRSTMCRYAEDVGNTLGATVVHAMFRDAVTRCAVLSTDATGAAIQPGPRDGSPKRPCRKGHFFTVVADCDHVLFSYTERHTQEEVADIFRGFKGILQADASSVYHLLERGVPADDRGGAAAGPVTLVGCFAHARRYFFEAAVCQQPVGVEGLKRFAAMYAVDDKLAHLPPVDRRRGRLVHLAPLIDEFFTWVRVAAQATTGRTLTTRALGYALNQEQELRRVLIDGRLPLDNTRSERSLRTIVVGRNNWLFYGSDIHAQAAAGLFSVISSCRLHRIDPERYIEEVLRLLPTWPKARHLELAPKHWVATRARLDPRQLDVPVGVITVPPPL